MIYIEIVNDKPNRCTNSEIIARKYTDFISTEYNDYDIYNIKYMYSNRQIILNPNYEDEQRKANRRLEILQRLEEIDRICIRAIRANETDKIEAYEAECEILRNELKEL